MSICCWLSTWSGNKCKGCALGDTRDIVLGPRTLTTLFLSSPKKSSDHRLISQGAFPPGRLESATPFIWIWCSTWQLYLSIQMTHGMTGTILRMLICMILFNPHTEVMYPHWRTKRITMLTFKRLSQTHQAIDSRTRYWIQVGFYSFTRNV